MSRKFIDIPAEELDAYFEGTSYTYNVRENGTICAHATNNQDCESEDKVRRHIETLNRKTIP